MNNYEEKKIFNNACNDADLNSEAKKDFSHYYHNHWPKWEREEDGYHGIYQKALDWWYDNQHKY